MSSENDSFMFVDDEEFEDLKNEKNEQKQKKEDENCKPISLQDEGNEGLFESVFIEIKQSLKNYEKKKKIEQSKIQSSLIEGTKKSDVKDNDESLNDWEIV